ncbi:MAG: peptidoglycan-N-acetylglucosamine deacetylase [Nocardioidaceae bacterium]|jgi:peptidoglycan/xylan/chitin deacetylase (PgdA/CDA1 family)|nr:peptidoglycan-N-acetylglucosamine deacetylase [Nocardioidaceae bacterium]
MLLAGIAWNDAGFEVAFRDADGDVPARPRHLHAGTSAELIEHLSRLHDELPDALVCVIDSTDGMVDGGLLARGVRVVRADPWLLPRRTGFGSVDADTLARAGVNRLAELTSLVLGEGTLTGRSSDHARHERDSAGTLASMTEAGRCLVRGRGGEDDPVVALTFDDGPNPPWTGRVLDVLDSYQVPATFFCVGLHADGHREELTRMVEAGHRIGNHTWSHPFLPDLSWPEVQEQLERTDEAIGREARQEERLFRPPYGAGTASMFATVGQDPATTTVLWDVDTNDWSMPGSHAIAAAALAQARPGSIVLMHDGGGDRSQTVEALPRIIDGLMGRGFRFARVDDPDVGFAGA